MPGFLFSFLIFFSFFHFSAFFHVLCFVLLSQKVREVLIHSATFPDPFTHSPLSVLLKLLDPSLPSSTSYDAQVFMNLPS